MFLGLIPKISRKVAKTIGCTRGAKKRTKKMSMRVSAVGPATKMAENDKKNGLTCDPEFCRNRSLETEFGTRNSELGIFHDNPLSSGFLTILTAVSVKCLRCRDVICQLNWLYLWDRGSICWRTTHFFCLQEDRLPEGGALMYGGISDLFC